MNRYLSAAALVTLSAFAAGCGKDSSAAPAGTSAPAAAPKPSDKPNAKPASDAKKKLPPKTAAKGDKVEGKKGGAGEKKPSAGSHKAADKTINASQRKKVDDQGDPCESLPDGVAECAGDTLFFCDDKELWALDCATLMPAAYPELFSAGTCYETPTLTDCMGAGLAEDGYVDVCTSDLSLCCDDSGDCYTFQ
jgi:hypothetical protein